MLTVIAKVFESLIHDQLYDYLVLKSFLNEAQSGFQPNHSTQDVLLKTVDDWKIALDEGKIVGAVMIDLCGTTRSTVFHFAAYPFTLFSSLNSRE